jgi:2-oxoglutarate ferredoxin oxidoreductase subunit alpha
MPVIAARSPADAFDCAIEAVRIATQYMTPVMLLTDGYIANAAEPWKVPDMSATRRFPVRFHDERRLRGGRKPLCARRKACPRLDQAGHAGLTHRIGGIEKNVGTGHIDYAPANHQEMTDIRASKVLACRRIPDQEVTLGQPGGRLAWSAGARPSARSTRPSAARAPAASTSATSTSATSGRCREISAIF